jgi:hypothetical protein
VVASGAGAAGAAGESKTQQSAGGKFNYDALDDSAQISDRKQAAESVPLAASAAAAAPPDAAVDAEENSDAFDSEFFVKSRIVSLLNLATGSDARYEEFWAQVLASAVQRFGEVCDAATW